MISILDEVFLGYIDFHCAQYWYSSLRCRALQKVNMDLPFGVSRTENDTTVEGVSTSSVRQLNARFRRVQLPPNSVSFHQLPLKSLRVVPR